ncbi:uncharacterized protein LOC144922739 [Branchiostoma floridae x Branchiostoma belcheri]
METTQRSPLCSRVTPPQAVMYRTAPNMAARVLATVVPLLFCCLGATAGQDDGPVVTTVTGQVRGTTTHSTDLPDKPIYTFLGIPYAAPPVGDLRYRPPQPAVPWEGVRDAVEYGSYCPQNLTSFNAMDHDFPEEFGENMTTSEDCLTVNVYTPTVAPDTPLPVLLWIHGGALMIGFGSPPGWEAIAAHQDVVVVSINYRLGVLGFLSTGDDNMPGNYGFLDQVHAMKWVKENIRNFGGDPDRVTIFGESAGGISVSYHLLSPLSKGLFQRAISQSGTWKTFPVNPDPLTVTKMFAEKAGCETEDTAVITACLKEKSPEELLEAFAALGFIPFLVPVVDGTFLTTDPMELMDKGEINTVDYLLGFNNHEMGWLALSESGMEGDPRDGMSQEEFVKLLRAALSMFYQGNPNVEKMLDAVVAEYRPTTPDDPLAILLQFTHVNGDSTFIGPTMLAAEKHADAGARIFLYENEYRPSIHPNRPDWVGSDHADDLFMIWGFPFLEGIKEQKYTKDDEKFSLIMMAYWANFARTGDPSDSTGGPPDSPSLPTWPQYTPDNPVYMKLDVEPTTGVGVKPEKIKLWNEVIPDLVAAGAQNDGPVVSTVTGQVRGTTTHTTDLPDKPIYTFLGIPYAAPPVGDLRYRPPQPAVPWEGVRDAVEVGPYCPQNMSMLNTLDFPMEFGKGMTESEDCLTVNVYTPTVAPDAALPVLLWIHGGGLAVFYGSPPGWEAIAAHQDVVVVSFNYRLGVLGFLSTGDDNMPGNYGFLDQVHAMKWIKENIRNFGGDPDRVTIFGESAGAISVSYHLLSPLSKGLFQRAISQSGTWKTFPVNPDPLTVTKMFAEKAGCEAEDTAVITACLKEKSPEDLLEAFASFGPLMYLVPVVDGTFLTADPKELMDKGEINTADYLLGFNNHEGGWLGLSYVLEDYENGISHEQFVNAVKAVMSFSYQGNPNFDKIVDTVVAAYQPTTPDDPMAILYEFTHINGDAWFTGPTILVVESHANAGARVFLYENSYRPSIFPSRPDWVGCEHGDDLVAIWGLPFTEGYTEPQNYTKEDRQFSLNTMAQWANFARTGDPSDSTGGPPDSPSLPTWPQYTPDNPVYMKLDVVPTTSVGFKPEKVKLWTEVIPDLAAAAASQDDGPVVTTVTGQVRGTTTHTTDLPDKPIYTFLGVPYAAPPVGDLRYRPPQPAVPWEGVRDAVEYGSYCPQNISVLNALDIPMEFGVNMTMSEDCLTVSVYTPTVASDAALPVLLWIHGGGLSVFYGSPPGWEAVAAHQDVVVVSFNYRLGVLGFLSTGDDNMPGNYGFLDQVRAMEWVKENIRNFGGDPDRVTIFGESAGAISVSYHLLSPLSKGLFQRAISQSGTWKTFPVNPDPLTVTKMFAEKAGCETEDTAVITACLKEKSPEELLEAVGSFGPLFYLLPVVDGTFLPADPKELMDKGEINTADYVIGFNNHEGGWMGLSSLIEGEFREGISQEQFVKAVKTVMSMVYQGNSNFDKIVDAVVAEYRPTTPDDPLAILYQFTHIAGDAWFTGPTMPVVDSHVNAGARVFLYENQYRPSIDQKRPDWVGCEHGDDLYMIWGLPFTEGYLQPAVNYTNEDIQFSLNIMAHWANFARTGDPSDSTGGPPDSPSLPTWPQYTPDNPVYMKLDVVPTTGVGMKPEKVKFWNEVIPDLVAAGTKECPVVSTESGQVRGTVLYATDLPNKPIYTYLAIPYAAPPVGDLRYRPPQPALPWEGVREAVDLGSYCPQNLTFLNSMDLPYKVGTNMTMSEDCLTLTVFSPNVAADAALPVLFWIHGGGLSMGMGSFSGFEAFSAHQHVVVVSINYRLGVLGFLSTGDDSIPGNYGFLDQVRAMEWVKENIRNFGGDPGRVTIAGESAGGVSVSYQLLSPLSNGLFQRAISQSGTCTTMPVNPQPLQLTKLFAEEAGCETEDTATIAACLKEKTPEELLEKFQDLQMKLGPLYFGAVVDGTFLTSQPMDLMQAGDVNKADYLLGVSNHEFGWLMLPFAIQGDPLAGISQEDFGRLTKTVLSQVYQNNPNIDKMADAVVAMYPAKSDDPMAIEYEFSHLYGDFLFLGPAVFAADKHADASARVFFYENQYRPSIHTNRPDWVGCDHGDDIFIVYGMPFIDDTASYNITYSKTDEHVSLSMMAYWANFMRTGDPSDSTGGPPDSPSLPTWPQYTPDNPVYMKLDIEPTTGVGLKAEKLKFWNEVLPKLAAAKKDEL